MKVIEIIPNLVTRGRLGSHVTAGDVEGVGIKRVFSLYAGGEPCLKDPPWSGYTHAPMSDGAVVDREFVMRLAEDVAKGVRAKKKTLVMCRAGRNRTGLIVCTALHILRGMTGEEALMLFRSRRPRGVANPAFEAFLLTLK